MQQKSETKISFRDIVSPAFRRHGRGEAFCALTRQPENPQEAVRRWQMPWMYLRLFGILLFMAAVCIACIQLDIGRTFAVYIYAYFWCGSLVPLTLALFLWELNPLVNVSIFEMMGLALLAGLVCVLFGTPLDNSIVSGLMPPVWGAAKDSILMLGLTILVLAWSRKRMYGLDGLALGAAIGAGYALFSMLMASIAVTTNISLVMNAAGAGIPLFFGNHALWFAPAVGALCLRMNGEMLNIRHLLNVPFFLLLLLGFAEDCLMNTAIAPFGWTLLNAALISLPDWGNATVQVKHIILLVAGWSALVAIIRPCMAQALKVGSSVGIAAKDRMAHGRLVGIAGTYANRVLEVAEGQKVRIGRETGEQLLTLHGEGVSRVHCLLMMRGGRLIVRDLGSSNGTWLNGKQLENNRDVPLSKGDVIAIGSSKERFEVQ